MSDSATNSAWAVICRHLEEENRRVREEIRNYPKPIPACDAQFNFLLEQREALSLELTRARQLMDEDAGFESSRQSIDAFLRISAYLGESEKRDIRALIDNETR